MLADVSAKDELALWWDGWWRLEVRSLWLYGDVIVINETVGNVGCVVISSTRYELTRWMV